MFSDDDDYDDDYDDDGDDDEALGSKLESISLALGSNDQ
jgi:hypothetical protein